MRDSSLPALAIQLMRRHIGMKLMPWVLLSLSAMVLVALGTKYRAFRENFQDHRRADTRAQRGNYVPAFTSITVTDDSLTVGETPVGARQVLIFLTSTCPFCRETLPSWKQMAARLSTESSSDQGVQVVALTTDSMSVARAYAEANELPFPLVPFPSRKLASLYRAFVVPQTVVIDGEGRVLFVRHGVINTKQAIDSIVAALAAPDPSGNTEPRPRLSREDSNPAPSSAVP